jgi:hypothetical protein
MRREAADRGFVSSSIERAWWRNAGAESRRGTDLSNPTEAKERKRHET